MNFPSPHSFHSRLNRIHRIELLSDVAQMSLDGETRDPKNAGHVLGRLAGRYPRQNFSLPVSQIDLRRWLTSDMKPPQRSEGMQTYRFKYWNVFRQKLDTLSRGSHDRRSSSRLMDRNTQTITQSELCCLPHDTQLSEAHVPE